METRQRIPDELWEAAAALDQVHGLNTHLRSAEGPVEYPTGIDFIKEALLVVDLAGVHGTEGLIGVEEVGNVVR